MISVLPNGGRVLSLAQRHSWKLHSMISVLPNGGYLHGRDLHDWWLHSMISVLPNGGAAPPSNISSAFVALDDISATEWR